MRGATPGLRRCADCRPAASGTAAATARRAASSEPGPAYHEGRASQQGRRLSSRMASAAHVRSREGANRLRPLALRSPSGYNGLIPRGALPVLRFPPNFQKGSHEVSEIRGPRVCRVSPRVAGLCPAGACLYRHELLRYRCAGRTIPRPRPHEPQLRRASRVQSALPAQRRAEPRRRDDQHAGLAALSSLPVEQPVERVFRAVAGDGSRRRRATA